MMSSHEPFSFDSRAELLDKAGHLGIELPFQESIEPLLREIRLDGYTTANRLAVQPMEGFDADRGGSPGELTYRRYRRYAEGGSGLIWFEATSVIAEGRSNPHQLMITTENLDSFKRLTEETRKAFHRRFGNSHSLFLVLQLTHSGRYSCPEGKPLPQVVQFNPHLDGDGRDIHILTDAALERLQERFIRAARLAFDAGFDAVDVKACHGYLVNELLAAFTREEGRFGGSFENRIRFITEVVKTIRGELPHLHIALRLNASDMIPYPYGFGVSNDGSIAIDLSEPEALLQKLISMGCSIVNITLGNPCHRAYHGRPFDRGVPGTPSPEEHPLESIARLIDVTGQLQRTFPDIPFVGTGYSWLRHYFPHTGASVVAGEKASLIGLGRSSFAYPGAPRDLMERGMLDPSKVCICCSRCTELMRKGAPAGCVVRDGEIYGAKYRETMKR
jgi:2,4-dienoyl-CoA reductase-like NADH-dependent reductase (Old Yellow Enzyme family)